jgi:hypothetical protein
MLLGFYSSMLLPVKVNHSKQQTRADFDVLVSPSFIHLLLL